MRSRWASSSCSRATIGSARSGAYRIGANEVAIGITMPLFGVEMCRQRLAPAHFQRAVRTRRCTRPRTRSPPGSSIASCPRPSSARRARASPRSSRSSTSSPCREQAARATAGARAIRAAIEADDRVRALLQAAASLRRAASRSSGRPSCATACCASRSPARERRRGQLTTRRVAEQAQTSTPAVYELFGDKAGLVREIFFEGFRMLRRRFDRLAETDDPRADLARVSRRSARSSARTRSSSELMFSRPFTDFDPGPADGRPAGPCGVRRRARAPLHRRGRARRRPDRHRARAGRADAGPRRHRDGGMARHVEGVRRAAMGCRDPGDARWAQRPATFSAAAWRARAAASTASGGAAV